MIVRPPTDSRKAEFDYVLCRIFSFIFAVYVLYIVPVNDAPAFFCVCYSQWCHRIVASERTRIAKLFCCQFLCNANCWIPSTTLLPLLRGWLGSCSGEQIEDLNQTGSENNKDEKGNEGRTDAWAVLVALGNLAGVDVSPLGNVLVEFAGSVADFSWEWLHKSCLEKIRTKHDELLYL